MGLERFGMIFCSRHLAIVVIAFMTTFVQARADEVWLSTLDLSRVEQGWGQARSDRAVNGQPLAIGGIKFERGIGSHANSSIPIELGGKAQRLSAWVGVDDGTARRGSVVFRVEADGKDIWNSGVMRGGEPAKEVALDLTDVKLLVLHAGDADDGIEFDHADWADAKIEMQEGRPRLAIAPVEPAVILTPTPPPAPRINGAKVFGVRPGSPFLFTIAATGERPMIFSARGLPSGLRLDKKNGRLTGQLKKTGEYTVTLRAKNKYGKAERQFKIVCGSQ